MTKQEPTDKLAPVYNALLAFYGRPVWHPREEPLPELILTVLSQHTSDRNSFMAFEHLRSRYPRWEDVMNAPEQNLANTIRCGGLANTKAVRIKEILDLVLERTGGFDLGFLRDLPLEDAKEWLKSLPGVGPKTAAVVLSFSLGRPAFPIDTHIYRVLTRVGLIPPKMSADKAHGLVEGMLRPEQVYPFHMNTIRLGREICHAQKPEHELCPLRPYCDHYNRSK